MKTRSSFVSNSSSTSFTCCVCGENGSGMDASLSDFDMCECENGHTFCEDHQRSVVELTGQDKLQFLIDRVKRETYLSEEKKEEHINELKTLSPDDLEEEYDDDVKYNGCPSSYCPICMLEKILEKDGLLYLMKKHEYTIEQLTRYIQREFKSYDEFRDYIQPPKKSE